VHFIISETSINFDTDTIYIVKIIREAPYTKNKKVYDLEVLDCLVHPRQLIKKRKTYKDFVGKVYDAKNEKDFEELKKMITKEHYHKLMIDIFKS
jgi:hypothetical protein